MHERSEFRNHEHMLLFVVPQENYDNFVVQSYQNRNGLVRKQRIDINMKQYVGRINNHVNDNEKEDG